MTLIYAENVLLAVFEHRMKTGGKDRKNALNAIPADGIEYNVSQPSAVAFTHDEQGHSERVPRPNRRPQV